MTASFLPNVNVSGANRATLLGIQATGDHGEDVEHDGVEDGVGVVHGADTDVGARRGLHPGLGQVVRTIHGRGPGKSNGGPGRDALRLPSYLGCSRDMLSSRRSI